MELHILGIRHHGVGSAMNTLKRLEEIQPDYIIVEGPMELTTQFNQIGLDQFTPPVSILVYNPDNLKQSSFYPFAEFSPEWVAIDFAQKNNVEFVTADLPAKHAFGLRNEAIKLEEEKAALAEENEDEDENQDKIVEEDKMVKESPLPIHNRPIAKIAEAAGFDDPDLWWEHHIEQKYLTNAQEHFEGVLEVMSALREHYVNADYEANEQREAFMREAIRKAEKEGKENIVFVCGAWHAPALIDYKAKKKTDTPLLKKLPRAKVETAWIPWMNSRLSWASGYGAGLDSPGWYTHLWKFPKDDGRLWLIRAAEIFRSKKIDISTAHIIETFRLSTSLAAMRNLARPGLQEMNDAIISVMCMGDEILLNYIKENLTIGKRIGRIPPDLPKLPIQKDFEAKIKTYRFQIREDAKEYKLDLRTPRGLEKSVFLHRLNALDINWAEIKTVRSKGTFKEVWSLDWSPEIQLDIIDKAIWGNSIEIAAQNFIIERAKNTTDVVMITTMMREAIIAELFMAVDFLIKRIDDIISVSYDVPVLFQTVLPLINIYRYSDIRQTDQSVILTLIEGLLLKININLPNACYGLNEEAANTLFELISSLNSNISLLDNDQMVDSWYDAIERVRQQSDLSFLIQGAAHRILFDSEKLDLEVISIAMSKALSPGEEPMNTTLWVEGFLKGNAMILIIDHVIWNMLYTWVLNLDKETFDDLIPILRRTFSKYNPEERKQIGQKAKKGIDLQEESEEEFISEDFNYELANQALSEYSKLLGLTLKN